jgi:hypothetical protein
MQNATRPDRAEFIKETVDRLWDNGLCDWITLLLNVGEYVHGVSGGKLSYSFLIDGFTAPRRAADRNRGIVALLIYTGGKRLCPGVLALFGDVTGGLMSKDMSIGMAEVGPGDSLSKPAGMKTMDADDFTFGHLSEFAASMIALAECATAKPSRLRRAMDNIIGRKTAVRNAN